MGRFSVSCLLILASLLFHLFPMPVEQMGQVRFGSDVQRLRNPFQRHGRFLPQTSDSD
jgi:hypothetical protein